MKYTAIYRYGSSVSKGLKVSVFMHGEVFQPFGQLWYCPNCGSVWCNVSVIDTQDRRSCYTSIANICSNCSEGDVLRAKTRITLPGSILMEGHNTIADLSEEMLRKELLLELKAMTLLINEGVL